ncbi:NUDIX domain-containing protein [Actinomadura rubrisoli]|uniref:NUDIX domain-containing protein n=1 Tax=Actinomadura rubrisoli TaxID=2530368 RepID=UPI001FB793A6|nr:NUDIX domain-containing protein [Actinomadura rubrisoli]
MNGRLQWRLVRLRHRTFLVYAAGIVRDDQGRVLVLRHRLWPEHRAWGLPGGYVNPRERLEDGVAREVREETGLEVEVTSPPVQILSGFEFRVEVYYAAKPTGGRLELQTAEILEARWCAADELPAEMPDQHRELIATLVLS